MPQNITEKLIEAHLVEGTMFPGNEIGLRIDQTLTQDATGTMVMLELEAMQLDRVKTELSVQYVDHNLIQEDYRNPDDHLFLRSACERFGIWFSRPGNGVSHPCHQERFGIPGKTLLGSDSHTPAAGAMGMLAMGAGGMEVAMAMAGQTVHITMPHVWGICLTGKLPDWVSAKDVILELLRRHGVSGGRGYVLEYYGPGLETLTAMDRHVIANMGTELGATSSVFPSDGEVDRFLKSQQRQEDWQELVADVGATFDRDEEICLDELVPLIAMPSSPGNVIPVSELAGQPIYQAYIGSSANPGHRDFAVAAEMVKGNQIPAGVSFDINPTSRQVLLTLIRDGSLSALIAAGARVHQAGCNGCIGMGQAPASGRISLRTVPRNFPGRSGTEEDSVCLVSPETATASALTGKITDPRDMPIAYPHIKPPHNPVINTDWLSPPLPATESQKIQIVKGANIVSLPIFEGLPNRLELPVLLKVGDDISTDEIMPAGARVLPYRSNIPKISEFVFEQISESYVQRAHSVCDDGGHVIITGNNYGQGSSREHAALAPRYLGLRVVLAKSFARIHWQNLVNFGVLPLEFIKESDYDKIDVDCRLEFADLDQLSPQDQEISVKNITDSSTIQVRHRLSSQQIQMLKMGGLINEFRAENKDS